MKTTSSSDLPPFSFTDRDYRILYSLSIFGGLRAATLSTLLFWRDPQHWRPKPHSNCQHRLLMLYLHGYINRIEQPTIRTEGRKPYIHILTRKGARALADHLGREVRELEWRKLDVRSGHLFLEHLMWINEVRVAIMYALQHLPFDAQLVTWTDDTKLRRDHGQDKMTWRWPAPKGTVGKEEINTVLIPDGYFHIHTRRAEEQDWHHFTEIDRGTETVISSKEERRTFERKIRMYREYYKKDGLYLARYGTRAGRVLTVTTSEKRLAHLKRITEQAGGAGRFWFCTFADVTPVTVLTHPIWRKAGDDDLHSFFDVPKR